MKRRLRWVQVDEQEHAASPETPASGDTAPVTGPAPGPGRDRRGDGVRDVLTSRGAGWAVAAAMAGAVVGLSVAMATSSSPTVVVQPDGAAGLRGAPAGPARAALPGGALRAVAPGGRVQAQVPVRLRIHPGPAADPGPGCGPSPGSGRGPLQVRPRPAPGSGRRPGPGGADPGPGPAADQVPAAGPLQAPAQLRQLAQVPGPAGTLIPVPGAIQVLPGRQAIAGLAAPRAVRLRVRPGQVRVRLRLPANGRLQVLPGGAVPGPLRVMIPGPGQASLVPAALVPPARARLRIAFRNGTPVRARLLIPASLPGRARLRIQVPARHASRCPHEHRSPRPRPPRPTGNPRAGPGPSGWVCQRCANRPDWLLRPVSAVQVTVER